jgi:hypothetical protein
VAAAMDAADRLATTLRSGQCRREDGAAQTRTLTMLFNRTRADTLLGREGIEAVVATSRENVEYITGHQNPTHAHESVDDFRGVFASDSASRERRYSDSRSRNVHGQLRTA